MRKVIINEERETKALVDNEPAWVKRILDIYERIKRDDKWRE